MESHIEVYAGLSSNSGVLVTDVRYTILIRFPIIAQRSIGVHYFHTVVGLAVTKCL